MIQRQEMVRELWQLEVEERERQYREMDSLINLWIEENKPPENKFHNAKSTLNQ